MSIFISDYNISELYPIIKRVENFNEKEEYIKPTWKNAQIVTLIVMRSFEDPEYHKLEKGEKVYERSKIQDVARKYSQLYTDLKDHYKNEYRPALIQYSLRWERHNFYLNPPADIYENPDYEWDPIIMEFLNDPETFKYKEVIIIGKKNKYKLFFNVSLWGMIPGYIKWYKINEIKDIFNNKFPPYSSWKAPGHPILYGIDEKNNLFLRTNKTTIRELDDKSFLSAMAEVQDKRYTGRATLRTTTVITAKNDERKEFQAEMVFRISKGYQITEIKMPEKFVPNYIEPARQEEFKKIKVFANFIKQLDAPNKIVMPEVLNCLLSFLNPLATKEQALQGITAAIEYLEILNNDKNTVFKKDNQNIIEELKKMRLEIQKTHISFTTTENEEVDIKIKELLEINEQIMNNTKGHLLQKIVSTIAKQKQISLDEAKFQHTFNTHRVKAQYGGGSRKIIQFDPLDPYHQNQSSQIIVKNKNQLKLTNSDITDID